MLTFFCRFEQNTAVFGDGTTFEADVIVACTGYRNTFPFVEETHPDINEYGQNPRLLYKQVMISPWRSLLHLSDPCGV